jgi:hypothetical protein
MTEVRAQARARLASLLAALWLQITVVVFVYLQTKRSVSTPLAHWVDRVLHLFR